MTFKEKVYKLTAKIPRGKVVTYGQLARMAGSPQASRAVGMCMRTNTNTKVIPCHRVVSGTGALTGYAFGGIQAKKKILLKEGVIFVGERVDLKRSQINY